VPGASSTAGLPLPELGLAFGFAVVKDMTRADGKLYNTSICGSGVDANLVAGRLTERRGIGVEGVDGLGDAILDLSNLLTFSYCLITIIV
jgi:hypothetical protein